MRLFGQISGHGLETTVNITPGQTLILGSSPKAGSTRVAICSGRGSCAEGWRRDVHPSATQVITA